MNQILEYVKLEDYILNKYEGNIAKLFQEVFDTYVNAVRKSIAFYVLRSPEERKRLLIHTIPRALEPNADKIMLLG